MGYVIDSDGGPGCSSYTEEGFRGAVLNYYVNDADRRLYQSIATTEGFDSGSVFMVTVEHIVAVFTSLREEGLPPVVQVRLRLWMSYELSQDDVDERLGHIGNHWRRSRYR